MKKLKGSINQTRTLCKSCTIGYVYEGDTNCANCGAPFKYRRTIKDIIMDRDIMSAKDADILISDAKFDLEDRLHNPDEFGDPLEICEDWFGLEPDYIMELM